ncbi:MAG: sulfatase-like hydrolase/transferase [Rubripirellula sp.]|nr:sulfatase-like hydrolase/transferase [Rubripirellula sp.]
MKLMPVFCIVALFLFVSQVEGNESQPNIVFMIADDLGWGDVEFHGGQVPTPHLNQLLESGLELQQHYVAPVCSPTRAGFMTGRYWSRFGVTTPTNVLGLPMDTVTVAKALRDAGYSTCLTGKWHLGSELRWGPNHFGFDHSYGSLAGGVTPWSHFYKKGVHSVTWHRNEEMITEQGHVTDLLTNEAVDWIESRNADQPFFLYVPFTAVHLPIRESDEWLERVPESVAGSVPRQYAACILHLDDAVGRIVKAIDNAGESDNTLIVFTSDNGGSTDENNDTKYPDDKCPNGQLPGSNLPLRGKKGDLYEGGVRVPTIACWPGKIPAGTTAVTPVHVVDWMPTFCKLADPKMQTQTLKWDGNDIWPVLSGSGQLPQRSLYSAGVHFRSRALRQGDWKLIVFAEKGAVAERLELYNLRKDPREKSNVASLHPTRLSEMRQLLESMASNDRDALANSE